MPTAFTKKLGPEGERLWDKAKGVVDKEYGVSRKSDRYWRLVTGIAKKMVGKSDESVVVVADRLVAGCSFDELFEASYRHPWNLPRLKKTDDRSQKSAPNPDDPDDDEDDPDGK